MILLSVSVSVLASLVTCVVFVYLWRRRLRRELEIDMIVKKLKIEVGEMVTELNGTTERNIALLENQIRIVRELIDKAGKTTGVLKREKVKHDLASRVYTSLSRSKPLSIDVENESESENEPESDSNSIDFESLSTREKALVLNRQGEGLDTIASKLKLSRGEVELIISLHDRRH